ncbi:hypothetical protein CEXT_620871, partial [Caerostris extrusa]
MSPHKLGGEATRHLAHPPTKGSSRRIMREKKSIAASGEINRQKGNESHITISDAADEDLRCSAETNSTFLSFLEQKQ